MTTMRDNIREVVMLDGRSAECQAQLMGFERKALSNYMNDKIKPSARHLCAMADFYGVSTDYLLGRTDKKEMAK